MDLSNIIPKCTRSEWLTLASTIGIYAILLIISYSAWNAEKEKEMGIQSNPHEILYAQLGV